MEYDFLIENATVTDPARGIGEKRDVAISGGKIAEALPSPRDKVKQRIDAGGYHVFPGLIENHAHLYYGGSDMGLDADLAMLPNGVTAAFDYGSAGYANFPLFYQQVILGSQCTVRAYLNVSCSGVTVEHQYENLIPANFKPKQIERCFADYGHALLGIKIRIGKESDEDEKLSSLRRTMEIAGDIGCRAAVHVKNPPAPLADIAALMRPGDVWTHMYQLRGETFLDEKGRVKPALWDAKKRGVLFDGASGRTGFSIDILRRTLDQGFLPDLMGTDSVLQNFYERPMFNLVYTMSLFLNLGMELCEVVRLCTAAPAALMGAGDAAGTLAPGSRADLCVMKLREGPCRFFDAYGGELAGQKMLIPQMTLKNGRVVYRSIDF